MSDINIQKNKSLSHGMVTEGFFEIICLRRNWQRKTGKVFL